MFAGVFAKSFLAAVPLQLNLSQQNPPDGLLSFNRNTLIKKWRGGGDEVNGILRGTNLLLVATVVGLHSEKRVPKQYP